MLPRTREAGGTHRIQVIAWRSVLLDGLRHGDLAHRYLRAIPAGPLLFGESDSSRNGLREIQLERAVIDYQVVSD